MYDDIVTGDVIRLFDYTDASLGSCLYYVYGFDAFKINGVVCPWAPRRFNLKDKMPPNKAIELVPSEDLL